MIFLILGTQKFQFNRLLEEVDNLVKSGAIKDEVFAQIGYSTYKPEGYKYVQFLDSEKFKEMCSECNFVITHAGTGAIITALQYGKKVVAVPRLAKYEEHVDDHQLQISSVMEEKGYIEVVHDISELDEKINKVITNDYDKFKSNNENMLNLIRGYLKSM